MGLKDLVYDFVEERPFGDIPDNIKNHLDYDAIARDLGFDYVAEFENNILGVLKSGPKNYFLIVAFSTDFKGQMTGGF